ncbi:hypothetical protein ABPG74_010155 [Tetrahymena malaccensis]
MNFQDVQEAGQTIHYPQSTNNRYIYETRNPLIHFRPHSASVLNTHRFKQDYYMHKARIRKQSINGCKNDGFDIQMSEHKSRSLKPIIVDNKMKIKLSENSNSNKKSQKINLFKKMPNNTYQNANDFFLYLKASSRKSNQSCFIDRGSNDNDLYNVSPIKEKLLNVSKRSSISKSILKPLNIQDIQLDNQHKQNYFTQPKPKQHKETPLYGSPIKSPKKNNYSDYMNENSPPNTGKSQTSPIKREKQDQNLFDIFQKQTFFEKLRLKFGTSQILAMKYSPDDKYLAFSQSNGKVTIFSDVKGVSLQTIRQEYPCNSLRWNPAEQRHCLLEGYANGAVIYRQIKPNLTNRVIQVFEQGEKIEEQNQVNNNSINCLEFLPSGLSFLSGSSDSLIRQYDIVTGKKRNTIKYHKNRVFAIKSIDNNCFLSAGWDHTVFLYDLRASKVQKYIYGPMVFGDSLDFNNYQVLCGSWREYKQLEIFDLRNDQSQEIKWENISKNEIPNFVYCCQFSKVNQKHIVAGSTGKYELRVFDREDNYICVDAIDRTLTKGVFSLDFRNNSNHISFGTSDASYGLVEII